MGRSAWWRLIAAGAAVSVVCVAVLAVGRRESAIASDGGRAPAAAAVIRHVVIIYQENHSFDNVLGRFCMTAARCDGATHGRLGNGARIALAKATDIVAKVHHEKRDQLLALNGGKMDGFNLIYGCHRANGYRCYSQFSPSQIPNLAALARRFVVADHTFSTYTIPSWGAHLELATGRLDGFTGDNPIPSTTGHAVGPGWGCDSYRDARWRATPAAAPRDVPSCVPMKNGTGPYRPSPVKWVPTIMDRLSAAGRSWKLYSTTTTKRQLPYGWAICPTFADCLDTGQRRGMVPSGQVLTDAADGTLPAFSVVLPNGPDSQHNTTSMRRGDNWIGQVVSAISHGPDWRSTAIFITYDDCGCFYDHVAPPPHTGIRVPMVIVSPYARPGYTDSTVATFNSLLAYTEHVFGLKPLMAGDAGAYDFHRSFNYSQTPLSAPRMRESRIPARERRYLRTHESTADRGT